ncbi:uncharacterized protein LOC114522016 [Dendronephthya gigantea]|uniref:uncharacterized protein LOC114522016 n=1 Tax=Dendronephthya gigantea TaxID=151771 RepID=UPI00106A7B05|nr:uncharacterized protein LOC114522016 [Dendronephthya gigantea]XP_028398418.1 uncharacterized protein LOC114522016 [Dendronephthya gigantea]
MQMVRQRLNIIKRDSPAVTKPVKDGDLDEKIRRIREENKKREERFHEIEQDKKLALNAASEKKSDKTSPKVKSSEGNIDTNQNRTMMDGVQLGYHKKTTKGRGQRLLEMSHQPSKAKFFESRYHSDHLIEHLPGQISLKSKCRTSIRERIKTISKQSVTTKPDVSLNKEMEISNAHTECGNNVDCTGNDQCQEATKGNKELLQHTKGDPSTNEEKSLEYMLDEVDIQEATKEQNQGESTEGNIVPTHTTNPETDKDILNDVQEQDTINKTDTSQTQSQAETSNSTPKNEKPKITVKLKKTVSNSSFDESMSLLSPLDLPKNWGDLDFSDDDLLPVSIWKD